ncbi:MAG: hypothetical protein CK425_11675 [Parachlamydia sp.]|nr:MAG: hypothetical protein CK425_11675 [Parachlamydia sp.]
MLEDCLFFANKEASPPIQLLPFYLFGVFAIKNFRILLRERFQMLSLKSGKEFLRSREKLDFF